MLSDFIIILRHIYFAAGIIAENSLLGNMQRTHIFEKIRFGVFTVQHLIPADLPKPVGRHCLISESCKKSLTDRQCDGLHVQVHDVFAFAGKLFIKNV